MNVRMLVISIGLVALPALASAQTGEVEVEAEVASPDQGGVVFVESSEVEIVEEGQTPPPPPEASRDRFRTAPGPKMDLKSFSLSIERSGSHIPGTVRRPKIALSRQNHALSGTLHRIASPLVYTQPHSARHRTPVSAHRHSTHGRQPLTVK